MRRNTDRSRFPIYIVFNWYHSIGPIYIYIHRFIFFGVTMSKFWWATNRQIHVCLPPPNRYSRRDHHHSIGCWGWLPTVYTEIPSAHQSVALENRDKLTRSDMDMILSYLFVSKKQSEDWNNIKHHYSFVVMFNSIDQKSGDVWFFELWRGPFAFERRTSGGCRGRMFGSSEVPKRRSKMAESHLSSKFGNLS